MNGAAAQVANRTFLATDVPLAIGPNVIQAVGRDRVGNAATTQITVTRQAVTAQAQIRLVSGNNQTGADRLARCRAARRRRSTDAARRAGAEQAGHLQGDAERRAGRGGRRRPRRPSWRRPTRRGRRRCSGRSAAAPARAATRVEAYAVGVRGHGHLHGDGHAGRRRQDRRRHRQRSDRRHRPAAAEAVHRRRRRRWQQPARRRAGDVHGRARAAAASTVRPASTVDTDSDGRVAATLTLGIAGRQREQPRRGDLPVEPGLPGGVHRLGSCAGRSREDDDLRRRPRQQQRADSRRDRARGAHERAALERRRRADGDRRSQTDAQGQFSIAQAPVGLVKLLVDGSTAQRAGHLSVARVRHGDRRGPEQHRRPADLSAAAEHRQSALRHRDDRRRHADDARRRRASR